MMMQFRSPLLGAIVVGFVLMTPALTRAQVAPPQQLDDATRPRIRIRGLSVNPTIAVSNAGVDSNVFNSVDDPRRDFTMTVSPALNGWVRAGRARVAVRGQSDIVYFQRYASERSFDGGFGAKFQVPLNRISPWVQGGIYSARQRSGYEVDLRSRRILTDTSAGIDYRFGGKTTLGLSVHRSETAWSGDAQLFGNSLSDSLDFVSTAATVTYRQDLTALTAVVTEVSTVADRFRVATERNADSVRVVAGFDLKTRALIDGSARVGFRNFDTVGGGAESYRGVVAEVDLGYVLRGVTRFSVEVERDTNYSFDRDYPYFVQTGVSIAVTQRIIGSWDAQARANHQQLSYRSRIGSLTSIVGRMDKVDRYGLGAGYRLNQDLRLGFNLDREQRASALDSRAYRGYRFGGSATYER